MPERAASDAALRFVHDLRSLREARGVALSAVHDVTRVPLDVLEGFETSALSGNRLFNRVYLRSLVRGYTDVIGFDPDRALLALEEALAGHYDGALLREPEPAPEPEEAASPGAPDPVSSSEIEEGTPLIVAEDAPATAPTPDVVEATRPPEEVPPSPPTRPSAPAEPTGFTASRSPASPPTPVAWDAVSGSTRNPRVRQRDVPWGLLAGIGVLALLIVAAVWWFMRDRDAEPVAPIEQPARDTVVAQQPPPQPVTLPDTLVLRVTATNGPVSDIKITVDDDVRRPYWIEMQNSRDFTFRNRIIVERELADATFQVNGRAYPAARQDSAGRLVISRDTVMRLLQQR